MSSKNGEPELISLLQYMKYTTLANQDILTISPQLMELDKIVNEVRESIEWEDIKMNLIELGREQGIAEEHKNTERERQRADKAKQRADEATQRADKATERAKKAIQRNKQLESELSKLRMQLAQLTQTP